jgi:hypothetical protein
VTFTAGALNVNDTGSASTDGFVTGNITTQNLNANSGVATAASTVATSTLNGVSNISVQVTGTYTGALTLQASLDGANWVNFTGTASLLSLAGVYSATIASAAVGIWQADVAAYRFVRITALAAVTGTAVVSIESSGAAGTVALDAALPPGSGVSAASAYPVFATPTTNSSGNVAAATATATLAAVAAKTTYITGFQVTAGGATAGADVTLTVVGVIGGTMSYTFTAPTGAVVPAQPLLVTFNPAIPGSAVNTAIVVSMPTLGTGNTNATISAQGYVI